MSDHPSIVAALANPAKPDGSPVPMALVQIVERPARQTIRADGTVVSTRPAIVVGTVLQIISLPPMTSFHPPTNTALIPAATLKVGDIATAEQIASVLPR
jgi:hypothetical protein